MSLSRFTRSRMHANRIFMRFIRAWMLSNASSQNSPRLRQRRTKIGTSNSIMCVLIWRFVTRPRSSAGTDAHSSQSLLTSASLSTRQAVARPGSSEKPSKSGLTLAMSASTPRMRCTAYCARRNFQSASRFSFFMRRSIMMPMKGVEAPTCRLERVVAHPKDLGPGSREFELLRERAVGQGPPRETQRPRPDLHRGGEGWHHRQSDEAQAHAAKRTPAAPLARPSKV
mmetsp:Transcript_7755/g.27555  ORF Transcript_7755/g.27555 Transcript_7755/m.27555 type:complete len:227 (+) Transcript_7755:100-780(+)